ncbi:MAG TPA: bifunctional serine/threonine-protein kinase/universal stress protein [Anaeromyxobacteraceae bacterium]|nr:bifunctional serine/threonine-protein kinase/universal stress protein [Anaeromyxobacteraceae bacterium]
MAEALQIGATLDGFRIEAQVHSGGMAVLYRVSGPPTGFPLLMKVPRLGHGEPASSLISFEVEQMVLEALEGRHVPRFVAKGDLAKVPYLVMEQVEGQSLHEWVARAPLPAEEVARLGAAVADALHSLHLQDAIHLDLKPANVMIRPDGEAVLVDFGLAHHGQFPDLLAEEYRRPIGSAPYISPEQIAGGRSDPRSDLFSLGVVLYELATGELPFGRPTSEGGLRARLWHAPQPPRAVAPGVPEWLQEVILHCLEVDARDRYPSASQVAFDLAHPDHVAVGDRGRGLRKPGRLSVLRRWVRAVGYEPPEVPRASAAVARASIVLAAVASTHADPAQADAIREAVRRILATGEHTRLAVVSVVRPTPELGGSTREETASRQRIRHLVALRHWAEPLHLSAGQVAFHVVESAEPAEALLAYARANHVDHIVIGAPPRDVALRGMLGAVSTRVAPDAAPEPLSFFRLLGTVSTKVAAEAPCTVTVVRARTS